MYAVLVPATPMCRPNWHDSSFFSWSLSATFRLRQIELAACVGSCCNAWQHTRVREKHRERSNRCRPGVAEIQARPNSATGMHRRLDQSGERRVFGIILLLGRWHPEVVPGGMRAGGMRDEDAWTSCVQLPLIVSPSALGAAWRGSVDAIRLSPAAKYLRGLTPARIGLTVLICLALTVRQHEPMHVSAYFGIPNCGTSAGFALFLGRQVLFSLLMLFAVTIADNLTMHSRCARADSWLCAAVLVGATAYAFAFLDTQPANVLEGAGGHHRVLFLTYFSRALLYGGLATAALYFFAREREETRKPSPGETGERFLDRQMIEAHLEALQAQIEPHFLFNTLANIKLLYETEATRAKPLIHDLADICDALPQIREASSTLARELALAQAYLRVLKVRMGERLEVGVDVPAGLRRGHRASNDVIDAGGERDQARVEPIAPRRDASSLAPNVWATGFA